MTCAASSITSTLLEEMAMIASELGENEILSSVEALRSHGHAAKLQLLVVGSTGSGRSTLTNFLLGCPNLLPSSPIPKSPASLRLQHGERFSATRVGQEGDRTTISSDQLRSTLVDANVNRVDIHVKSPLLEMCDLRVEALEADRSPTQWQEILGLTDFVILLLNATALLSHGERQFARDQLAETFGLERVGIVINAMDLVPDEERSSLVDLVRVFLGPFQSQPVILEFSAREATRAAGANTMSNALTTLVRDVLDRRVPLRSLAVWQATSVVLADLEAAATRKHALYALEESEVQRLQETIAVQGKHLESRIERTQTRIEAFVQTLLKEQCLRGIEGFGQVVRTRLPTEIESIDDVALIRRHLPGYIETVWTEFLRDQMIAMRDQLAAEEAQLNAMIETDLRGLVALGPEPREGARDFDGNPTTLHVFLMPKRGKHQASSIARGLSLNGLLMLFLSPPIGIMSLVASQTIQRLFKGDIGQAEKQAIIASAITASRELERELNRRVEQQYAAIAAQLKDEVARAYRQGVEQVSEMLEERAARRQDLEARRARIASIVRSTLPRLRTLMTQPDGIAAP